MDVTSLSLSQVCQLNAYSSSSKRKTLCALPNSEQDVLPHRFQGGIIGEIELVEACVRRRQPIFSTRLVNLEPLRAVHPLKAFEPIDGDLRGPGDELHKIRLFLLGHVVDDLPEPLDQLRRRRYPLVLRVGFEVVHVDVGEAAYEELKLLLVENREELWIYYLAKSFQKSIDLALDALCQLLFRDQLEVFLLVSVCDLDVLTVLLQLVDDLLPKHRVLQGERHAQALAVDVVLADPFEALVVRRIDGLDVRKRGLHAQHVLVEGACEVRVEELLVVDGLPDEAADELEVVQVVRVHVRIRVGLKHVGVVRSGSE
mmetsp:Transcript_17729/g.28304  ORF Transcript_17729/g.28304 Transcript_17729/m.28304 type:complete len:314 (+) Transcript_17729:167-1108(+)